MSNASSLLSETIISLSEAARRLPAYRGSGRASPSTIWRWISKGVKLPNGEKILLEAVRLGGHWLTTVEAMARFAERQTAVFQPEPDPTPRTLFRTPLQRLRASEQAARELEKTGI